MIPLETYIRELHEIRSSGATVKETSYYGPLASLFNEIGKCLTPKVKCIINLQNRGAGLPDGGFFTQEQFQKAGDHESMPGQMPARGAIEVKSTKDDALVTADGDQVTRYLGKYRQVLVTNYRDFVLGAAWSITRLRYSVNLSPCSWAVRRGCRAASQKAASLSANR